MRALIPLLTPATAFLLHATLNRLHRGFSQQRVAMWSALFASLFVSVVFWKTPGESILVGISSLALGYCYFHLFNISETGIRPRILIELQKNPDLTTLCKSARYDDQSRLENRLARLESFGALSSIDGNYEIRPSLMVFIAALFSHRRFRRLFDYQTP